jgi:hypothetical protein
VTCPNKSRGNKGNKIMEQSSFHILAVSDINVYLSYKFFNNNQEKEYKEIFEFQKNFAEMLIYIKYLVEEAQKQLEV